MISLLAVGTLGRRLPSPTLASLAVQHTPLQSREPVLGRCTGEGGRAVPNGAPGDLPNLTDLLDLLDVRAPCRCRVEAHILCSKRPAHSPLRPCPRHPPPGIRAQNTRRTGSSPASSCTAVLLAAVWHDRPLRILTPPTTPPARPSMRPPPPG
ncbi:MAG: hypothetical protein FE78DRAFT_368107 [Acidomyces sp. 'richmondensis']|nr:MAG: hypothetical protein FE78DRAFT_368107 [Acidomyces sp. 'richmondensis']